MRFKIFGFIIGIIYWCLHKTWKITIDEPELLKYQLKNKIPFIIAHWHGHELALMHFAYRYKLATIVSSSRDGEMMAAALTVMGAKFSRGSSSRNSVQALKGLLSLVKKGHNTSFAVDGPKGPIYEVKPGVLEVSRLMKASIYCGGVSCDRYWQSQKAWNKAILPKPFAKVHITWTEPLGPVDKTVDPRSEVELAKIKNALHHAQDLSVKKFASLYQ